MATRGCSKYILIVLNVLVFLVGGTHLGAGLMLKLGSGLLETEVVTLLNRIMYNNLPLGIVGETVAYLMMGFGGLAMIVATLGMCGAWRKMKGCLIVYIVVIVFLIVLQACLIGLWMVLRERSGQWLRGKLLDQLDSSYMGPTATDAVSAGFNTLFMKAECCGVNDQYKDGSTSDFPTSGGVPATDKLPATCCQGVDSSTISNYEGSTCATTPINFYSEGCYDRISDTIGLYSLLAAISCGVLVLVEIIAIVTSCMVMDSVKNKVQDISNTGRPPPYIAIDKFMEAAALQRKRKDNAARQISPGKISPGRVSNGY